MSEYIEQIYNNFIADEIIKSGTKYEKITAVVYKILDKDSIVVHDMRLRGDGKSASHQIDVTVEKDNNTKRILIECKDYDEVIGIGIIRDFFGAVSQIKPDSAIVITTKGFTKGAIDFAHDEGIKLAILRKFEDDDWEGRIKKISLNIKMHFISVPRITSWIGFDEKEIDKAKVALKKKWGKTIETNTMTNYFYDEKGQVVDTLQNILQPIFNALANDKEGMHSGRYEFNKKYYILLCDEMVAIKGFEYEFIINTAKFNQIIDDGKKVAVMIYKIIDENSDDIIFDKDIEKWTFDVKGEVVQKKRL